MSRSEKVCLDCIFGHPVSISNNSSFLEAFSAIFPPKIMYALESSDESHHNSDEPPSRHRLDSSSSESVFEAVVQLNVPSIRQDQVVNSVQPQPTKVTAQPPPVNERNKNKVAVLPPRPQYREQRVRGVSTASQRGLPDMLRSGNLRFEWFVPSELWKERRIEQLFGHLYATSMHPIDALQQPARLSEQSFFYDKHVLEFLYTSRPRGYITVHVPMYNSVYAALAIWLFGSAVYVWDMRYVLTRYVTAQNFRLPNLGKSRSGRP